MKKLVALMLCALLALPAFALAEEEKVLNILSWEGYVDADTLAAFEEETGIEVIWSPMDSIDSMLLKVSEGGGADYDLIISSDYSLDILRKQGLIQKLDMSKLSNYGNLDPAFLSQTYDPDNEYVIPYMAGCPLIIYDPERVSFEITGYEDLWNPELADSVAVLENARVLCGITLKTMGKSMNETDPDVLAQMKEKLMPLYPNIRTFGDMESYSAVTTGEASVGFLFHALCVHGAAGPSRIQGGLSQGGAGLRHRRPGHPHGRQACGRRPSVPGLPDASGSRGPQRRNAVLHVRQSGGPGLSERYLPRGQRDERARRAARGRRVHRGRGRDGNHLSGDLHRL